MKSLQSDHMKQVYVQQLSVGFSIEVCFSFKASTASVCSKPKCTDLLKKKKIYLNFLAQLFLEKSVYI